MFHIYMFHQNSFQKTRYFEKIKKKLNLKAEIQAGDAEELDEQNGRKILALFEKRLRKNQELRIKHAKKPEKFMKSEIELHDMIQGISKDSYFDCNSGLQGP